ncbi:MAG: hypothetical protein ING73_11275 [Rhodocyclaceae bacterium]|nr:hypothetical protein [Rhodocyclaceae bacterium]
MKIEYVTMNKREALTIIVGGGLACALTGAAICAAMMIALTSKKPVVDDADVMTSERAKGMMLKISAAPARCQQWQQRARRAVCEE